MSASSPANGSGAARARAWCTYALPDGVASSTCVPAQRPAACLRLLWPPTPEDLRRDVRLGYAPLLVPIVLCPGCIGAHLPRLLAERERRLAGADALLPALMGDPAPARTPAPAPAPHIVDPDWPWLFANECVGLLIGTLRRDLKAEAIWTLRPDVPSEWLKMLFAAAGLVCDLLRANPDLALSGTPLHVELPESEPGSSEAVPAHAHDGAGTERYGVVVGGVRLRLPPKMGLDELERLCLRAAERNEKGDRYRSIATMLKRAGGPHSDHTAKRWVAAGYGLRAERGGTAPPRQPPGAT